MNIILFTEKFIILLKNIEDVFKMFITSYLQYLHGVSS